MINTLTIQYWTIDQYRFVNAKQLTYYAGEYVELRRYNCFCRPLKEYIYTGVSLTPNSYSVSWQS